MSKQICDSCGGEVEMSGKSELSTIICEKCINHMSIFIETVEQEQQEFQEMLTES